MTRSEIFTWAFPIMTMWCLFIIAHTAAAIMCRSWIIAEPFPTHSSFTTRHGAGGKVGPRAPTSINFKTDFRTKNMHKVSFDFIELFILCVRWIVHVGKRYDVDLSMQNNIHNTQLLFFVETLAPCCANYNGIHDSYIDVTRLVIYWFSSHSKIFH